MKTNNIDFKANIFALQKGTDETKYYKKPPNMNKRQKTTIIIELV